jgi:hypothetical protein
LTAKENTRAAYWVPLIIVAAVFAIAAGWHITLPGLYMDAVNPDFLVVRILNPNGYEIPPWILPGNYPAQRFPILTALYHGTQQVWLGLPGFLIFGTTLIGLRITHALFAFAIIWSVYAMLVDRKIPHGWAAVTCAALALDPALIYAFRTQSYVSTAPIMWIFLSILKMNRATDIYSDSTRRDLTLSGLFFGIAIYGYFTYLFFFPTLVIALVIRLRRAIVASAAQRNLVPSLARWAGGVLLGMTFYFVGYAIVAGRSGGIGGLFSYIAHAQADLGAFNSQLSFAERVGNACDLVVAVFSNWWNSALMFNDYTRAPAATWKIVMLIGLPFVLWAIAEYRKTATDLLRLLLGLEISFFVVSLIFGSRLGGHHYACLVPLSYAALATTLVAATRDRDAPAPALRTPWGASALLVVGALIAINVAGDRQMTAKLSETHGVGLYSDAINHFAEDLLQTKRDHFLILPDWGLYMPIVFLTGANIQISTDEDINAAKHFLCHKRNVSVALINGDRAVRFSDWQRRLLWKAPVIEDYRQFDGKVVFQVGTFVADSHDSSCVQ